MLQVKWHKGYSFIEILVVVSVIAVLSGLSLATYNNFTQQQNLDKEAKRLVDVLEIAKKKADAPDSAITCTGTFLGYSVNVLAGSYQVQYHCSSSDTSLSPAITYTFPSGFSAINTGIVNFLLLTGGANNIFFTLRNSNISRCINITVSNTGIIDISSQYGC